MSVLSRAIIGVLGFFVPEWLVRPFSYCMRQSNVQFHQQKNYSNISLGKDIEIQK